MSRLRAHIRSNVVGYVALFLTLTAGIAWASHPGGMDTINGDDIINGSVQTNDLNNGNGVRTEDVRDDTLAGGGLRTADLAPDSVGTSEVSTIKGADIEEATLGVVPQADSADRVDLMHTDAQSVYLPAPSLVLEPIFTMSGIGQLLAACNSPAEATFLFDSTAPTQLDLYLDNGGANPSQEVIGIGGETASRTASPVDMFVWHMSENSLDVASPRLATLIFSVRETPSGANPGCYFRIRGFWSN